MLERRSFLRCCFELLAPPCTYPGGGGPPPGMDCHLLLTNGVDALLLSDGVSFLLTMQCGGGMATTHYCEGFTFPWTGSDMAGLSVTVTFSDATTETQRWISLGSGAGQALGVANIWTLTESGDTQTQTWTLTNTTGKGITQVVLDGEAGAGSTAASIFNTTLGGGKTAGTDTGQTYVKTGGTTAATITATYSVPVALIMAAPLGDLYTTLTLAFPSVGGMLNGDTLVFKAATIGCGTGAFGPVAPALLIWHVECEFNCWASLAPNVQAVDAQPVLRWDDLQGTGSNLVPLHVPLNTVSQSTRYQDVSELGIHRADIQCGTDWRAIFQGNFNFITPNAQLSYAFFGRVMETTMAMMSDGTPGTNGFAFGFGSNGSLEDTSGLNNSLVGAKDGANGGVTAFENSGIPPSPNAALVATYDGMNGGLTTYYLLTSGVSSGTVTTGASFSRKVVAASGGFALGGSFNNSDPSRVTNSLSNVEAAIWRGILTPAQIQTLADRVFGYWNF